jgi:hypothetical protein
MDGRIEGQKGTPEAQLKKLGILAQAKFWRMAGIEYAKDTIRNFAKRAPTHWSTGSKTLFAEQGRPGVVKFRSGAAGPLYQEWGTRPHTIRPKWKPFLAWPASGRMQSAYTVKSPQKYIYTTKAVQHPGTKALGIMKSVINATWNIFKRKDLPGMITNAVRR